MQEKTGDMRAPEATSSDAGSSRVDPGAAEVASAKGKAVAPGPPADVRAQSFDEVDDASDDSFPASDAPSWTGMRAGSPRSDL
jgi:hypothetical protein